MNHPLCRKNNFLAYVEKKLQNISTLDGFVLACLFIAIWTLYFTVTEMPVALKHDMTEAYSWGQEFQLGYHQHPPFWAWVCGIWFSVFPANILSFAALSATNSAVGLWGIWHLTAKLVKNPAQRLTASLLPLLTPLYTFYAFKFNANIIFLSLWPWVLSFFFSASEQKNKRATYLFGIMAGLTLLSKYYALLPLSGCLLAALCTPNGRLWLRSWQPWLAGAVATLITLPHILWLFTHKAPPLAYLRTKLGFAWHDVTCAALKAEGGLLGMISGISVMLAALYYWHKKSTPTARPLTHSLTKWVLAVTLTPIVLTLAFGLSMQTIVMAEMMIGVVPLLPLLIFQAFGTLPAHFVARVTLFVTLIVNAGALLAAPLYTAWRIDFTKGWRKQLPVQDMAQEATRLWHERTHAPLMYVAGSTWYANGTSFYSPEHPHSFPNSDPTLAPWVTPARIHRYGVLTICPVTAEDAGCLENAAHYTTPQTVKIAVNMAHHFAGHATPDHSFVVMITPPSS
ncbi:glycosyltransferase family 39 protein [Acetobacter orientalis]|uniref:Glycosyltransferase RgtA/B/C/D-like domain-containing protein n=1 Tax=Acetobacter orientalis TaxID=146474 RepID=A0A252A5N8_9PROT|nr:glycosyltransferase family 39 protein [Acetobacter orientalis]OUI84903.1 hypothetical protein HK12_13250 [Acetobacter orientalis]